jgi:hypothetical protein
MSFPKKWIEPSEGRSSPEQALNVVVLPAPLGPISPEPDRQPLDPQARGVAVLAVLAVVAVLEVLAVLAVLAVTHRDAPFVRPVDRPAPSRTRAGPGSVRDAVLAAASCSRSAAGSAEPRRSADRDAVATPPCPAP